MPACFGCGTPVLDEPGRYYCDPCVERQLADQRAEQVAFDAFHQYADRIAREGPH